jgi:hypothetical protein
MKIYINNLNIDILNNLLHIFNDKYIDSETYIQIYSIDGIYKINDSQIKKLNIIDKEIELFQNYYNNFTLIVDKSFFIEENVHSINPEHISIKLKRCFFKSYQKSNVQLVIEGPINEDLTLNKHFIKPNDIYFEINDNIDIKDDLIKKEIIVFLSLLN